MRERIIILGAGIMQGPAIRIARELGFFAIALDGNSGAPCAGLANAFERIDLKDKEEVEAFARSLGSEGRLGIMTAGTDFSATVAWVAQRLSLPGIPYETALNATDKPRMRARFAAAGLPSPAFAEIDARADLGAFVPPAPFPLVVKPVDSMGARGCSRADDPAGLREAALDAIANSRSGRAIVEGFIPGPEFSVDAIVHRGKIEICGLADRHIFFPPRFIEMGHTIPSCAPDEQKRAILDAFCAGVRALGIADEGNVGAAKGDVKLSPDGPVLGEIAARLSGGFMSGWTYPYSSGAEPIRAAILLAMGKEPAALEPTRDWTCAERAFISIPGTIKEIIGARAARERPFVKDVFVLARAGEKADFPQNNVSKCGNVLCAAPDRAQAEEAARLAAASILARLDPADARTEDFLSRAGEDFPPDAFALPPALRELLAALPDDEPSRGGFTIRPFPQLMESGLLDYAGRSVSEALDAARELSGMDLPEIPADGALKSPQTADNESVCFGRPFWAALARGSCQGAAYHAQRKAARLRGLF